MDNNKQLKCPTCRTAVSYAGNPDRPFCSERCRLLDLAKWAAEEYRIPAEKAPDEAERADDLSE
jgi:uncharacterized protein